MTARDLPAPTVRWVLFGFSGRIARQSFILGQLFMLALFAFVVARIVAVEGDESATVFWGIAFLGLGALSAWSSFAMTAKRLHDIGQPGILAAILLVPWINVIFVLALMVLPSQPRTNPYGPPPFAPAEPQAGRQNDSSTD